MRVARFSRKGADEQSAREIFSNEKVGVVSFCRGAVEEEEEEGGGGKRVLPREKEGKI